ncbi:hypothetical protein [Paenibacillus sp. Marseille-Q4541]|uniref:hypothetical protein n=1 Tax=Paenibacillus sp. Marseille-Q4541 TaxID=2831522 RepID=UPI001BAC3408|nr:hypothetical protein [Paenibacillus sp. Marseille-Q4541]
MKKRGFSFVGVILATGLLTFIGINDIHHSYCDEPFDPVHSIVSTKGDTMYYDLSLPENDNEPGSTARWIRSIHNDARRKAKEDNNLNNLHLILRKNGEVIYNGTTNNITNIPSYATDRPSSLHSQKVLQKVERAFTSHHIKTHSIRIKNCTLGGNLVVVKLYTDLSEVNSLLSDIESLFTSLNKLEKTDISQYELTFLDSRSQSLLFLSADLVYRDFFWWQAPELNDVWTGSPQRKSSFDSSQKIGG